MMIVRAPFAGWMILGIALVPAGGCVGPFARAPGAAESSTASGLSREELSDLLEQFEDRFEASVRQAADEIVSTDGDRKMRRLALLWQMRMIPMVRDALNQDDPVRSLLDAWTICVRMERFLSDGDGRVLFGERQDVARAAATKCVNDVETVAARILDPSKLDEARAAVRALADRYPLRGEFSGPAIRTAVQRPEEGSAAIDAVLAVPLAPFRAIGGIDRGAAAIQGFAAVAARMTDVVQDLPEGVRLQAELLAMEFEGLESVQGALASFQEFSRSAARLAAVAENLPRELRTELTRALDETDARQEGVQRTLADAREVVRQADEALERLSASAAAIETTAAQTARAGEAWTGTFHALTEMVQTFRSPVAGPDAAGAMRAEAAGSEDERRPFDIDDYRRSAEAIDRAAASLQGLANDLRTLAGSGEFTGAVRQLQRSMEELLATSQTGLMDASDRLGWRAAQIVILVFVLLFGYRVATWRMASRP